MIKRLGSGVAERKLETPNRFVVYGYESCGAAVRCLVSDTDYNNRAPSSLLPFPIFGVCITLCVYCVFE
jgi:hypothetical protein